METTVEKQAVTVPGSSSGPTGVSIGDAVDQAIQAMIHDDKGSASQVAAAPKRSTRVRAVRKQPPTVNDQREPVPTKKRRQVKPKINGTVSGDDVEGEKLSNGLPPTKKAATKQASPRSKRTQKPVTRYECHRCGKTATTEVLFLKHRENCVKSATNVPTGMKCSYCEEILDGDRFINKHFASHHCGWDKKIEPCQDSHPCPLCRSEFGSLKSWLYHVQNHKLEKAFECAICHSTFSLQKDFQEHVLTHPVDVSYSCGLCPEKFALPISLDAHTRTHQSQQRGYQCKVCGTVYKHQKTLLTHMNRVHGNKESAIGAKEQTMQKNVNEDQETTGDVGEFVIWAGGEAAKPEPTHVVEDSAAMDDDRDGNWSDENKEVVKKRRVQRRRKAATYRSDDEEEETEFPCDLCDEKFSSKKLRKQHFSSDHSGAMNCVPCNLTFNHRRGLRRHRIRCHGPKTNSWVCEVCGKAFDCTYALSTHRRVHFAPKRHACSICGMKFQRAENMRRHEARHSGTKAFMCDTCGACYTTKFILQKHLETHADAKEKIYLCDICGEGFARPNVLKWHRQSDCGKKKLSERPMGAPARGRVPGVQNASSRQLLPFPCPMCKKGFKEQDILDRHVKSFHTNDSRLICPECGIRFRTEATLKTHMAIHTSLKFKCQYCNKEFLRDTLRAIHEREKHTGDKPFKCKFCDESFSRKGKMAAHQLVHYGREIKCEFCGMLFAKLDTKNKHVKKHTNQRPYVCNLCTRAFKEKYNLEIHMRTHSNRKAFVCKVCGKRYSDAGGLNNHMRTHDQGGLAQFACDICEQRFENSEALVIHSESHTDYRQEGTTVQVRQVQQVGTPGLVPVFQTGITTGQVQGQIFKSQSETGVPVQVFDIQGLEALRQQQLVTQQQQLQNVQQQQQVQQQQPQQQQTVQQQQQQNVQQQNLPQQQEQLTAQHHQQLIIQQQQITQQQQTLERAFEIQVLEQLQQRPQQFSLDQLPRVSGFTTADQIVMQRPQTTFTVDNLQTIQRPQMTIMDAFQRPQLWNLNPNLNQ